jgi:hypothetical protein
MACGQLSVSILTSAAKQSITLDYLMVSTLMRFLNKETANAPRWGGSSAHTLDLRRAHMHRPVGLLSEERLSGSRLSARDVSLEHIRRLLQSSRPRARIPTERSLRPSRSMGTEAPRGGMAGGELLFVCSCCWIRAGGKNGR